MERLHDNCLFSFNLEICLTWLIFKLSYVTLGIVHNPYVYIFEIYNFLFSNNQVLFKGEAFLFDRCIARPSRTCWRLVYFFLFWHFNSLSWHLRVWTDRPYLKTYVQILATSRRIPYPNFSGDKRADFNLQKFKPNPKSAILVHFLFK